MPSDKIKPLEQFWRKYEVLDEVAPEPQPLLEDFIPFLEVAYRTWLRSGNVDLQIETDIQHHIVMQKQFAQLRELECDPLRTNPA